MQDKALKLLEEAKNIARLINPSSKCQVEVETGDNGKHYWVASVSSLYLSYHPFDGRTATEALRKLIAFLKLEAKNKISLLKLTIKDLQKI